MKLPEIVTVGIYNSQINAKNIKISKNRKASMFEIELPLENGGVTYIDSDSVVIEPDLIICAKPGQVRHTRFPFKCLYVHMILHEGVLYDTLMNTPNFFKTDMRDVYEKIFLKMVKYHNTFSKSDEIKLQSLILDLIYTIEQDKAKFFRINNANTSNSYMVIENALDYISKHLTEDLSLDKIAKISHLSPIHFHNCFKGAVGKTLRDYIEEQRLRKAINLLSTTGYSLTKIAYECGFSSQSYFSYVFKRKIKKTPREYTREANLKYEI